MKCLTEKWEDVKHHTSLSKSLFLEAVSICLKSSYLCYNNTFYSQITGLAMGSPLSAIVSEIVLDNLFHKINVKYNNDVKFKTKYVDDSIYFKRKLF